MTHHNRVRLSKLSLGLIVALAAAPVFAQSTSSGVGGRILGADGQPVAGADVTITHTESGTVSRAVTDANGRYAARGLRVGGPYTITINKAGAGTTSKNDVYLGLDQVAQVDAQLQNDVATLGAVTVVASSGVEVFQSDNKGLSTNLSRVEIDRMPSPDRSIQSIVRADPRVVVTDRDRGAFSAVGQNFRYNSITVDNINVGDPFGLNDNGLPTKGSPISPEAIESYNISTANYDVGTRRGVGAVVNAITKSGTNDFHGSLYYVFQNADDLIGENAAGRKWTGFTKDTTKGASFGGPILKDKLFFFASYEEGVKTSPGSIWGPAGSGATNTVNNLSQDQVNQISAIARSKGLEPGDSQGSGLDLESKRGLVKFDWNINDAHRASLTLRRTEEIEPIIVQGTSSRLNLSSNWYVFDKTNTAYALSLYDDWSDNFSTEFSVGFNKFEQTRGPLNGKYQPEVTVRTSGSTSPGVVMGTEFSSQANVLGVDTWNGYFAGNWFLGDHVIKAGIDYQSDDFYNLFLQNYNGSYEFDSIADFEAGRYRRYRLNVPAAGYTLDNVAAVFKQKQYGFFVQDTWQATDQLSLQFGFRYDLPKVDPDPTFNPCFAAAPGTLGNLGPCGLRNNPANASAAVGGYGFSNAGTIDGNGVFQPRVSFNYNFDSDRPTQLRGGAGLFVSNTPAVWVANPYSNNGVAVTGYDINRFRLPTDPAFSSDPYNQNIPGGAVTPPGLGSSQMNLSVVDPDFEIPTVAKFTLGIDHELPWWGTVFTAEYQHLDVIKGIRYENLNFGAPTGVLPDGRPSYARFPNQLPASSNTTRWNANPSFGQQMIYLTNTEKGKADTFTVQFKKPFADSWSGSIGYTFSRATDVNPGTSSVANSSFQNRSWVNANDDYEATSNYSIPHRIIASLVWEHNFFGDYATRVSAFYDGHSGAPYSWIFGNDVNGDSYVRDLAFIPINRTDVAFTPGTSQALIDSFFQYIGNDPELMRNAGRIFKRNDGRAAWVNQLDLSISQEIPGFMKGHKGELRFDIFNVLNMIDKSWGVERRADFPLERRLADFAGVNAEGKYIYDISSPNYNKGGVYQPNAMPVNESFVPSQRWSILVTARYTF
ncbi:MAG TPA: TonB-dependent receptor [Luteimonas sp.]|nr:TonB-dependent receptor [Luteimonas sp.]